MFLDERESAMYLKAIYGEHAMRFAARLILQEQGDSNGGKPITAIVGALVGEARSAFAQENNCPHEMIECEVIIRPLRKFTGRDHVGCGLSGLVKSSAMFPDSWEYQSFPEVKQQRDTGR